MTAQPTLAVWKFASCDGCQLTLLDCEDELLTLAGEVQDRALPRGVQRGVPRARTTCRSSRDRSRPPPDARAHPRGPGAVPGPDHHRRVRHVRRHPGAAQLRRRRASSARWCTPAPSTSPRSRPRRRHRRARAGRLRAARLPDRPRPAARGDHRLPRRPQAGHARTPASAPSASAAALTCVMVADGTPCLGPVTHAGCGALCPASRPRLLRLLRPDDGRRTSRR